MVDEIVAAGGEALANGASVTDFDAVQAMVQQALDAWGRVDVIVNNAGILRDKSFLKMELADFRLVLEVHLMGAVHCCKALWPVMMQQKYGRIVLTSSSSGLYGNFGQANYGAAKMALVGLMQTLAIEGAKNDIRVNCLAPTAATRMTRKTCSPPDMLDAFRAGGGGAGDAGAGQRWRADPHDPVRGRRRLRGGARHVDAGCLHRRRPRDGRRSNCWPSSMPCGTARENKCGAGRRERGRQRDAPGARIS